MKPISLHLFWEGLYKVRWLITYWTWYLTQNINLIMVLKLIEFKRLIQKIILFSILYHDSIKRHFLHLTISINYIIFIKLNYIKSSIKILSTGLPPVQIPHNISNWNQPFRKIKERPKFFQVKPIKNCLFTS